MKTTSPRRINLWKKGWDAFRDGKEFTKSMPKAWQAGWLDSEQDALEWWRREYEYEQLQRQIERQWWEENPNG